jgi:hypothetical protein
MYDTWGLRSADSGANRRLVRKTIAKFEQDYFKKTQISSD